MKKTSNDIEKEVAKTLASLDGVKPAAPKPFLFTRISARLENMREPSGASITLSPVLERLFTAALVGLLAFNLISMSQFLGADTDISDTSADESVAFMEDYYPETLNLYSIDETSMQ
jgi:hypothetical protein